MNSDVLGLYLESLSLQARRRHVTALILLDNSISMSTTFQEGECGSEMRKTRMEAASEGACMVIDELRHGDHVAVLAFGDETQDVSGGCVELSDLKKSELKQRIKSIKTTGSTKLYDTIILASSILIDVAAQSKVVGNVVQQDVGTFWLICLTDGEDTSSLRSHNDVLANFRLLSLLLPGLINIALIGINLDNGPRRKMEQMAEAGGSDARFVDARNLQAVINAFEEIRLCISRQRLICPLPCAPLPDHIAKGMHVRVIGQSFGADKASLGDVGVVQSRDSDGNYKVNFPLVNGLNARPSDLVEDPAAERVRPGALVAFKRSVKEPLFHWGMKDSDRNLHGLVVEVKDDGTVYMQFGAKPDGGPRDNLWRGQLQDLEVVDSGAFHEQLYHRWRGNLQLGMAVHVPDNITPRTRMGNLKRGEVGYVRGYIPYSNLYVCDFPSVDGWKGYESDLEMDRMATLIRPGKHVRVRRGVTTPTRGWGGVVTPSSVGVVLSSHYDGGCVEVKFPECPQWRGTLAELETVEVTDVHPIVCDACGRQSIQGPRYKCMNCPNYNLCQTCFDAGNHRENSFWRIDRPDSVAVEVKRFQDGQSVCIMGLVPDPHALNGQCGMIVKKIRPKDSYYVKLPDKDLADKYLVFKGINLEAVDFPFPIGAVVKTKDLEKKNENGKEGVVIGYNAAKDRVPVRLLDEYRVLEVKPDKLKQDPDAGAA